MLRRFLTT